MASLGLGIGAGASVSMAFYAFVVICISAIAAFCAMNPLGAMTLMAQLGYFIVKAVVGAVQIIIAGAYWILKNAVIMVANIFIGLFNLFIGLANWLANIFVGWLSITGWQGIPYLQYLAVESVPKTIEDVIADIGLAWQDVVVAAGYYWAGAGAWAPYSYVTGASVGAGTGYAGYEYIYKPKARSFNPREYRQKGTKGRGPGKRPPGHKHKRRII